MTTSGDPSRRRFEDETRYPAARICRSEEREPRDYVDRLLSVKLALVRQHNAGGLLVDLCCATGTHLPAVRRPTQQAVGVDFSVVYLGHARERLGSETEGLHLVAGDARALPLATACVDVLYSLSALYVIPDLQRVLAEVARVLRPGGRCVLDLGNLHSLNAWCLRHHYPDWPSPHLAIAEQLEACRAGGLRIIEHRCFQLLPLWADRPPWLWPLLHPVWQRWLKLRVRGKMLDEWLSSLPLLRRFAFRHLVVCERCSG